MSRRSGSTTVELLPVHFQWLGKPQCVRVLGSHSVNVGQVAPAAACLFGPGRDGGHLTGGSPSRPRFIRRRACPGPQSAPVRVAPTHKHTGTQRHWLGQPPGDVRSVDEECPIVDVGDIFSADASDGAMGWSGPNVVQTTVQAVQVPIERVRMGKF